MSKLTSTIRRFVRDEQGATTAEYGIIVVIMAAIAFAVLTNLDATMGTLYSGAADEVDNAVGFQSAN